MKEEDTLEKDQAMEAVVNPSAAHEVWCWGGGGGVETGTVDNPSGGIGNVRCVPSDYRNVGFYLGCCAYNLLISSQERLVLKWVGSRAVM
jgi:hypothetical protein